MDLVVTVFVVCGCIAIGAAGIAWLCREHRAKCEEEDREYETWENLSQDERDYLRWFFK